MPPWVYVCRDFYDSWSIAPPELVRKINQETSTTFCPKEVAQVFQCEVDIVPCGNRYARYGDYRLLAHYDGGYSHTWLSPLNREWCLFPRGKQMPEDVERALCCALGLTYQKKG